MRENSAAQYSDDEIDLRELWNIVWSERLLIVIVTAIFALASIVYALIQTDIYRAEAVLAPAEAGQSGSPLANQLGGAAALVGINIGSQGDGRIGTALAIMRSREFIRRFVAEHDAAVPLFAGTWDSSTGESGIDSAIYDVETNEWVNRNSPPSDLQVFRQLSGILEINQENTTGLVRVAIRWHDPAQASEWVNQLVQDINRDIKEADIEEANNAIRYLQQQLETTQLVDMQRVFYQLIESQTRITMLADVRDEYVFQVIDPAVVPDQKVAPRRSLIVIVGTLAGGFLTVLFVFLRNAIKSSGTPRTRDTL